MPVPDEGDESQDFALAEFIYGVQTAQIDRSAVNAQGLLTALALLAAFSSPLVVVDSSSGWAGVVVGAALIVLFSCIAAAAYWTLRVMYIGRHAHSRLAKGTGNGGFLYFGDITQHDSPSAFAEHCAQISDDDRLRHLYEQAWQLAQLVKSKARATVLAVKWTLASLIVFLIVLVLRYSELNL